MAKKAARKKTAPKPETPQVSASRPETPQFSDSRPETPPVSAAGQTVSLPQMERAPEGGYAPAHIDIRLKPAQRQAMKDLWYSLLQDKSVQCELKRPSDAVRWLLDQVASIGR